MSTSTLLKLGQVAGVLLLAAGVASCQMATDGGRGTPLLFLAGGLLYGGCRLWAWLRRPQ